MQEDKGANNNKRIISHKLNLPHRDHHKNGYDDDRKDSREVYTDDGSLGGSYQVHTPSVPASMIVILVVMIVVVVMMMVTINLSQNRRILVSSHLSS